MRPNLPGEMQELKNLFHSTMAYYENVIRDWDNFLRGSEARHLDIESRKIAGKIGKLEEEQKRCILEGMKAASGIFEENISWFYISAKDAKELSEFFTVTLHECKEDLATDMPGEDKVFFEKGMDMARIAFTEVCLPSVAMASGQD